MTNETEGISYHGDGAFTSSECLPKIDDDGVS
jgi:hypothetical protein